MGIGREETAAQGASDSLREDISVVEGDSMISRAYLSPDRRFRYWLLREWDAALPKVAFIGLNPSTADETIDDPTIRRCMGFARTWGKGGLLMLNLYAFRATAPAEMWRAQKAGTDIIGGESGYCTALQGYAKEQNCDLVIAAWGVHGFKRGPDVSSRWNSLMCLARNSDGSPKHPLYLKTDLQPVPYKAF
jgi:hypothetical protein